MTNQLTHEIGIFAQRQNVPAAHAHTLPSIFDKLAEIGNKPVRAVVNMATYNNQPLADYIKELAEQIAGQTA